MWGVSLTLIASFEALPNLKRQNNDVLLEKGYDILPYTFHFNIALYR